MHTIRSSPSASLALFFFVALAAAMPQGALAGDPEISSEYQWLDVNLQPLPFQDHEGIRDAIRFSTIVDREMIGRGVAGTEILILEHDGAQFHAAFRSVDVTKRAPPAAGVRKRPMRYRDAAIFECAAYELSVMLGIDRVPPTNQRRIGEQDGTVQIWMEETLPEDELLHRELLKPPDVARWRQQKQIMHFFDNLIANSDRNQGNILIDRSWTLWFIDHTRAFRADSELLHRDKVTGCERGLWKALGEIDEKTLRQRLEPFLKSREISKLLRRRTKLIDHIQDLIKENGEAAVLFDLLPPGTETATWSTAAPPQ